ncbi:Hypothetical predicted protein [Cloeon dipterum]|uniref:Protein-lysine N-methyltransferase SMYD4 n=1 Tax=Cloeon dipterum TaxID=197152 RepID=A0A8S1D323_9INSE|nr:Hypothetical predicted protein [Cloeon dipterum]
MAAAENSFEHFDPFYRRLSSLLGADKVARFAECSSDEQRVLLLQRLLAEAKIRLQPLKAGQKDQQLAQKYLDAAQSVVALLDEFDTSTENEGVLQHVSKALRLFGEAVNHAPTGSRVGSDAHLGRAGLLSKLGQCADALNDCQRGTVAPDDIDFLCQFALIRSACLAKEDRKAAQVEIREALAALSKSQLAKPEKAQMTMKLVSQMKRLSDGPRPPRLPPHEPPECPKLFQGPHATIPNASSALDLRESPEKGRYLVANTTIPAGAVVIVDEPYAWMLSPSAWHDHCTHCCRPVLAPLPCPTCTQVCFCSRECMSEALASYHGFECSLLHHVAGSGELSSMALLVMRVVLRAREHLARPPDDATFARVHQQVGNSDARPVGDLVKRTAAALFLAQGLRDAGLTAQGCLLEVAMLRHLQSCSCNAYEISETVQPALQTSGWSRQAEAIGGAVYATISLANHGCWANVARLSHGRRCVVRCVRRVERGEELLDNYGYSFLSVGPEERQSALAKQYFFQCGCQPCQQRWPCFHQLRPDTRFRCQKCGKQSGKPSCKNCHSKAACKDIERRIRLFSDRFQVALARVKVCDVDESVEQWLAEYIEEMQDRVEHPNKELLVAQQALIKIWAWQANRNSVLVLNEP